MLDQHTINKIAAGEVIERPASVIKELVENSIDAKASAITIEIKDGGIPFIRVTDNGTGIPKKDIQIAFLRHTTSKIQKDEDLLHISSLGFRGEALASIAAVSQIEMITKTPHEITGIRIEVEGGKICNEEEVGCPEGTTIIMRNLFFNTPARRKFFKKPATETGYISDMIQKIALGHPEISFKFINNNSIILHTSGNNNLENCIFHIYGKNMIKHMIPVKAEADYMKIIGYIGKPQIHRGNRNYESFFINGRYIKSVILQNCVESAYKTLLPINKFPIVVLHLQINPKYVDVNVHPTKMEVRFRDEDEVYQWVLKVLTERLKKENLIPQVSWESTPTNKKDKMVPEPIQETIPEPFEIPRTPIVSSPTAPTTQVPFSSTYKDEIRIESKPLHTLPERVKENTTEAVTSQPSSIFSSTYHIVGQLFKTYWIVEAENKMYIIDQHAAHERILYEKLLKDYGTQAPFSQTLLEPWVLELSLKEQQTLKDNISLLIDFGFEVEEFGENTYILRALPIIFNRPLGKDFFIELIDLLQETSFGNVYETKLEKVASLACKAAVKAMDSLSMSESRALVQQLLALENPYTCPHGRPTIIEMTQYELEKKFHRIQ